MRNAVGSGHQHSAVRFHPSRRAARAAGVVLAAGVIAAAALPSQPVLAVGNGCEDAWAGDGTAGDPFVIADAEDLRALSDNTNSDCWTDHFVQTADIDLDNDPFIPIAYDVSSGFTGVYDGSGHTISGLRVETGDGGLGLFYRLDGATVIDLVVDGVIDIDDQEEVDNVGGLAGEAQASTITNVTSRVDITLTFDDEDEAEATSVGGVVGDARAGTTLTGVTWHGTLAVTVDDAEEASVRDLGGIAGRLVDATIRDSSAMGTISVLTHTDDDALVRFVGGAVGDLSAGSLIEQVASSVSLSIDSDEVHRVGSFVGEASEDSSITDAYAVGPISLDVDTYTHAGGFIGAGRDGAAVSRAYTAASIGVLSGAADGPVGRFVGRSDGLTLDAVFYEEGPLPDGVTSSDQLGATEASPAKMRTASTFIDAGWDFTSVWGMESGLNDGLPVLCIHHGGTSGSSPCAPSSASSGSSRSTDGQMGPIEEDDGTLPGPGPGVATIIVDGQSHEVEIVALDGATVVIEFDGIRIELTVVDDDGRPIGLDGDTLALDGQRRLRVVATGLEQWTDFEIWLFSTPQLIDVARSDVDGRVHATIGGFDAASGRHTLQFVGTDANERTAAIALGVQVGHDPSTLAFTGPTSPGAIAVAVVAALLALALGTHLLRRHPSPGLH